MSENEDVTPEDFEHLVDALERVGEVLVTLATQAQNLSQLVDKMSVNMLHLALAVDDHTRRVEKLEARDNPIG